MSSTADGLDCEAVLYFVLHVKVERKVDLPRTIDASWLSPTQYLDRPVIRNRIEKHLLHVTGQTSCVEKSLIPLS